MNRFFRHAAHGVYGFYAVTVFWIMIVPLGVGAALLPGFERRRRAARGGARLIVAALGIRLKVEGLEQLPSDACVIAANHASYLDGLLLTAALPPRFSFVIKREVTKLPVAHFVLRRIGSEFVERFDRHRGAMDARRLLRSASDGQALAFFPEGTFRREPGLRRFHGGAFAAAARAGVSVIPVVILGSRQVLPAGSWLPRHHPIRIIVQPPVTAADTDANPVHTLKKETRVSLMEHLDEPDLTV